MNEITPEDIADKETIEYITSELDHDLREGLHDRVRWNNRAMMLVLNAYFASSKIERLRADKIRLTASEWAFCESVLAAGVDRCKGVAEWEGDVTMAQSILDKLKMTPKEP